MDTKYCNKCSQHLPLSAFNKNKAKKDGLASSCRECQKVVKNRHYQNNKAKVRANNAARNKSYEIENKRNVIEYLLNNPCANCGETDIRKLEFNHVKPGKYKNVSSMYKNHPWPVVLKEINKCEVLCSNCHAVYTAKQTNNFKQQYLDSL